MSQFLQQYEHSFGSILGRQLYDLLPEIYRTRDSVSRNEVGRELGDLARFFDASGYVLDLIHNTLQQRLADSFPDDPSGDSRKCQDWLLPYFARLVDARLFSVEPNARRAEVANVIAWRQRKGTLVNIEAIASQFLGDSVYLQEGINRVATTAQIGMAYMPLSAYGINAKTDPGKRIENTRMPGWATKHPALPVCTVDMRCQSRAVISKDVLPITKSLVIDGISYRIHQVNHHGVPKSYETHDAVYVSNYDDISIRTVDVRRPDWRVGHIHPGRVLIYTPIPMGLFPYPVIALNKLDLNSRYLLITPAEQQSTATIIPVIRKISAVGRRPVSVTTNVTLPDDLGNAWKDLDMNSGFTVIENLEFVDKLTISEGIVHLSGVKARQLEIAVAGTSEPALIAKNCLFGSIIAKQARVKLQNCTVLKDIYCAAIEAENCLFQGVHHQNSHDFPLEGTIGFSRITPELFDYACQGDVPGCATPRPFWNLQHCTTKAPSYFSTTYAEPGAGVLKPDNSPEIYAGAKNSLEIGCFNQGRTYPVVINKSVTIQVPDDNKYVLRDIVFAGTVTVDVDSRDALQLDSVAIKHLTISLWDTQPDPLVKSFSLAATNCLFEQLTLNQGAVRLEYCTVLGNIRKNKDVVLQISDCIFADDADKHFPAPSTQDCIRYSRIPPAILAMANTSLRLPACVDNPVLFWHHAFDEAVSGKAGCGVLRPVDSQALTQGAEDGTEMGAHHGFYYSARHTSLLKKLEMYLPYGIEPALIYQQSLHDIPEELQVIGKKER